ncbi:HAD-IA family hydrolase, partial [Thermodesulfobacteriota bacterium]
MSSPRKKPAPDIYLLALEKTGKDPSQCIVIEDSRNGMLAGDSAGV